MKLSARNQIKGKVVEVHKGDERKQPRGVLAVVPGTTLAIPTVSHSSSGSRAA
jgi:molybdopterin-binding protein